MRPLTAIGVLVAPPEGPPSTPPDGLPLGRSALRLSACGIDVVFGERLARGRLSGLRATVRGWEAVEAAAVCALYDRYPSQSRAARYRDVLEAAAGVPIANAPIANALCCDKLVCQRVLEAEGLAPPQMAVDPEAFAAALHAWGSAFWKPRFGSFGRGVQFVRDGEATPVASPGDGHNGAPQMLLQRAVRPPPGWAGVCVRALGQRSVEGGWQIAPTVARSSRVDPVVSAARGAQVEPAEDVLPTGTVERCAAFGRRCCEALARHLDGHLVIELGVDLAIDDAFEPHVIEVNGRPRGRLRTLASRYPQRFGEAEARICDRPLRVLAEMFG